VADAGNAPSFELTLELLDVPEEQDAALTPTVSRRWAFGTFRDSGNSLILGLSSNVP
jgi:hypothetical protein